MRRKVRDCRTSVRLSFATSSRTSRAQPRAEITGSGDEREASDWIGVRVGSGALSALAGKGRIEEGAIKRRCEEEKKSGTLRFYFWRGGEQEDGRYSFRLILLARSVLSDRLWSGRRDECMMHCGFPCGARSGLDPTAVRIGIRKWKADGASICDAPSALPVRESKSMD